jgi:hypothetical protein
MPHDESNTKKNINQTWTVMGHRTARNLRSSNTTMNRKLVPIRVHHVQLPRSGPILLSTTVTRRRTAGDLAMLCLLLVGVSVAVLATTSCAPIPCPTGDTDPDWCRRQGSGGGGLG